MLNTKLAQVIAKALEIDFQEISLTSSIDTVEKWDSVGQLEIILGIEKAFGVRFHTDDIPELISVGKLHHFLKKEGVI